MKLPPQLMPLSSKVDWCEENYQILSFIAEFWNTISNILFLLIPPILMVKFKHYGQVLDMPINIIWILFMTVGIGSVYFHATLSLAGQLIDEIAIIWVIMGSWALFMPSYVMRKLVPNWVSRYQFRNCIVVLTITLTCICCINPEINHFALPLFTFPCIGSIVSFKRKTANPTVCRLAETSMAWFAIGFVAWILDQHLCDYLTHFPYLHCFWHVFICLGGYLSIVCTAYVYAEFDHSETKPRIAFWPFEGRLMKLVGIPYVELRGTKKGK